MAKLTPELSEAVIDELADGSLRILRGIYYDKENGVDKSASALVGLERLEALRESLALRLGRD
jgi:hypothetical protein